MRTLRMAGDQRRDELLRAGIELLGQRAYDEVSIAAIAEAAGVSKGLLYHYFPTKSDFVVAVLEAAREELGEITAPDPSLSPLAQVDASLDAFLGFVSEHAPAYAAIFRTRGAATDGAVQTALESARQERIDSMIAVIASWPGADSEALTGSAALRTAIQGWIFFVEGAVLRWLEEGGLDRDQLRELLRRSLFASLDSARAVDPGVELPAPVSA